MTRATRGRERQARLARASIRLDRMTIPGVSPETPRTILQAEADRPLQGGIADLQHDGIFGDAHKQQQLF
jgi:hypothetical protein